MFWIGPFWNTCCLCRLIPYTCGLQLTFSLFLSLQNGREDPLLTNALMTPPRSSTFLDTSLHKDVFGAISGTCEWKSATADLPNRSSLFLIISVCPVWLQLLLTLPQLPTLTLCVTQTPAARSSAPILPTACLRRTTTRATRWTR